MTGIHDALAALFGELIDGPPENEAYMLNAGDLGLLQSLDRLPAADASRMTSSGGASIAAHVDHIRYGIELMNRWSGGEADPWGSADWTASWRLASVTEGEWTALREQLRAQTRSWHQALQQPRELNDVELKGVFGSIAHLAYHLGAIRQINSAIQGPKAA